MAIFKDPATGKIFDFAADVVAMKTQDGAYTFVDRLGRPLATPATLQPYTPPVPSPPTTAQLADAALVKEAIVALRATDGMMLRIAEAVALGLNGWEGADVVAFVTYRRALRAIVNGNTAGATALPAKPPNPSGT
jgi:hypothetical protein